MLSFRGASRGLLGVSLDVVDGVSDGLDFLGVLVGDLDLELLFERQHQLDDRQRVGLQVVRERRFQLDLVGGDLQLLNDDLLDLFFDFVGYLWVLSMQLFPFGGA